MQKYYGKINLGKEVIFFLLFLCLLMSAGCQNGAKENPQESIGIPGGVLACDGENLCHLNEFVVKNGLSYYSYQTGEWKTLCPDPLCTHENQSGCFMYGKRFVRGVLEENILYFSAWDIVSGSCILGSYDLKSMQLTEYVGYDRSSLLEEFVKYGDALYYYLINADGGYDIRRYDIRAKKDTLLYQYDQYIRSIQVGGGYLAFDTGDGLYLLHIETKNVRLILPMNKELLHSYYYFLHDGYLYYPANRFLPECWRETDMHRENELLPGDYYRFPVEGDISQSERVLSNTYGELLFQDGRIYYLPAKLHISARYYFHDKVSGSDDLPDNLFSITGNQGGIAVYDEETGEARSLIQFDKLDILGVNFVYGEKMIVTGFSMDDVCFDENRFIEGGYQTFLSHYGFYLIDLSKQTYRMLVQLIPSQDGY